MQQAEDNRTIDMLGHRGRPVTGTARTAAQRKADQRARKKAEGVQTLTVELSAELLDALRAMPRVKMQDESMSQAVERLLRNQLMRKR